MLGDIQVAEPGAIIGFAGARVIEQTIRETLPEGFQRAEYLLEHGMVDMVVHRADLQRTLALLQHKDPAAPLLLMDKEDRSKRKGKTPQDPKQTKLPPDPSVPDAELFDAVDEDQPKKS